jgi:hypothetical protein
MPYETFVYDLISYLHSFRTLHLHHHVVVDDRHLDVVDHQLVHLHLVCLICMEKMMVRHQYVVEILNLLMGHLMQDEVHLDVQQILDEQNLDEIQPFLDVVLQFLENPEDVVVGVELRHLLKMDCCLDEVDAEPHHQLKMDCYLDEAQVLLELQVLHFLLHDLLLHALQPLLY